MKLVFLVLLVLLPFYAMAVVPGGETLGAGDPISFSTWDMNLGSTTWVEFTNSMQYGCSAVQVQNTGSGVVKIGIGAVGSVRESGIMFPASGAVNTVGMKIRKGDRLVVKTDRDSQAAGYLTLSCLQ